MRVKYSQTPPPVVEEEAGSGVRVTKQLTQVRLTILHNSPETGGWCNVCFVSGQSPGLQRGGEGVRGAASWSARQTSLHNRGIPGHQVTHGHQVIIIIIIIIRDLDTGDQQVHVGHR